MDDSDGQMIFGDLGGLKLPDICLTGEEKPLKTPHPGNLSNRGSNPGPLDDMHACYLLSHSSRHLFSEIGLIILFTQIEFIDKTNSMY